MLAEPLGAGLRVRTPGFFRSAKISGRRSYVPTRAADAIVAWNDNRHGSEDFISSAITLPTAHYVPRSFIQHFIARPSRLRLEKTKAPEGAATPEMYGTCCLRWVQAGLRELNRVCRPLTPTRQPGGAS